MEFHVNQKTAYFGLRTATRHESSQIHNLFQEEFIICLFFTVLCYNGNICKVRLIDYMLLNAYSRQGKKGGLIKEG